MIGSVNAELVAGAYGADAEQRLFHTDEIKKALPRNSSALVLVAEPKTCDAMVKRFESYGPKVVRRQAADELRKILEALHAGVAREIAEGGGAGAPTTD